MSDSKIDADFAFDAMDTSRTKDHELLARIRREKPVCRPADGVVFTSRYHDTADGFRDAKRYSAVGDMRAPGVVVAEELGGG